MDETKLLCTGSPLNLSFFLHDFVVLMSRVVATTNFKAPDCRFLSLKKGDVIFVYYKLAGKRDNLWAGTVSWKIYLTLPTAGENVYQGLFESFFLFLSQTMIQNTVCTMHCLLCVQFRRGCLSLFSI